MDVEFFVNSVRAVVSGAFSKVPEALLHSGEQADQAFQAETRRA